jgi:hypothetical protein
VEAEVAVADELVVELEALVEVPVELEVAVELPIEAEVVVDEEGAIETALVVPPELDPPAALLLVVPLEVTVELLAPPDELEEPGTLSTVTVMSIQE